MSSHTVVEYLNFTRAKFNKDREAVQNVISDAGVPTESFKYYWMLVNSRCYFWNFAKSNKRKKRSKTRR